MFKRFLLTFLGMILASIKSINTRLAALEAGEIAEAAEDEANQVEMQKLLDDISSTLPGDTVPDAV